MLESNEQIDIEKYQLDHLNHFSLRQENKEITQINAQDFSVYYKSLLAVKNINIEIPKGKVTAIIGPSGCGKSTFLRSINRMNDLISGCYTKGKLLFNECDIYDSQIDLITLRKRVGMVFQKPNPFPKSIFDNVAFSPRLHGIKNKQQLNKIVEKCLNLAALWDEISMDLDKNALSLSGGQQQRLCIARALAAEPEILLMDEPTSALDPQATSKIEDLIAELRMDYTIIIVTHNMQQAARISDYTAFLYEGELVEFSKTTELFSKPKMKKTEEYITGRFG